MIVAPNNTMSVVIMPTVSEYYSVAVVFVNELPLIASVWLFSASTAQ